jgi:prepilin-type N-terminal cleavage/methylation domain-containing protein/prepilin-type processing-associated H-X9-DG protein
MLRSRPGLSLIELLVVLAIVLIVAGLLVPAVQKLREAAARAKCANNLKQIGIGFHSYHDIHGHFPPGGDNGPGATAACAAAACRDPEWSWAFHLLPYLEQADLYKNPDSGTVFSTPVRPFYCPARRPAAPQCGRAKLDYAGNAGTHPLGLNGAVRRTREGQLRLADIPDGAGATVLAGEKRLNAARLGVNPDDDESYANPGWAGDWEAYRLADPPPAPDYSDPADTAPRPGFGSSHPGTFNAVFCDGSVRSIRYGVSPEVWLRVCVRNDNPPPAPRPVSGW